MQLGVLVEHQVVGLEAAHDVLARVGAVDAQDELAAAELRVEVGEVLVGGVGVADLPRAPATSMLIG